MFNLDSPVYPNLPYPYTGQPTSANFIKQSLGSFFNNIFSEQGSIRGLTVGQVEELLQAYQDLNEVVYSYCVKDINVYHKQLWQPILLQKSQINMVPFLFEPTGAVFGPQPSTDPFFANQTFEFGKAKSPSTMVWSYTPPAGLVIGDFSCIANQVYNPSVYYIDGVHVSLQAENTLYFNSNPFNDSKNPVVNIIGQGGVPVTYVDQNGVTQQDQLLILWLYNANLDQSSLYQNFGLIFEIQQPSSEQYKDILKSFFNISVEGATITALKSLICYIGGVLPIIDPVEVVQYVAVNEYNQVVVTNLNSYLLPLGVTLAANVIVGNTLYAGDCLTNLFSFYDNISQKNWWQEVFSNLPSVSLSSSLFFGNYQYQLSVPNSLQLITLSEDGILSFPIDGYPSDVEIFENYINEPGNSIAIQSALGLNLSTNPKLNVQSVPVNPLNFLFENFFANNMALFVLNFYSADSAAAFFQIYPFVQKYLPKHVYFLLLIDINQPPDVYDNLNNKYTIAAYPGQIFNADGSDVNGNIAFESPYYYSNLPIRLFTLGNSPAVGGQPLSSTVDVMACNGDVSKQGIFLEGKLLTSIPAGATFATYGALKFIDFSAA